MGRLSRSRAVFTAALLMFSFGLPVQAFEFSSISSTTVSRMFLRTSVRTPPTCYCAKSPSKKEGTCYYLDNGKCKSRACESSYECKSGVKTNTLCIRRKTTSKMVMVHPGKCEKKPISGYQYVPYNSGPSLGSGGSGSTRKIPDVDTRPTSRTPPPSPTKPVVKPTKNKKGLFYVVIGDKVKYRTKSLNKAKKLLWKHKRGSRCIFQVRKGKVLKDPRHIAGYPQTREFGFNKSWKNKKDVQRMHRICVSYSKAPPKPKPVIKTKNVRGFFLVVGKRGVFPTNSLNKAKKHLSKIKRGSRCIFQVKGKKVVPNPHHIAAYPQTRRFGFNKAWRNPADIHRMYKIANSFFKHITRKPSPRPSPRPSSSSTPRPSPSSKPKVIKPRNKRGLFILVDGNKATFHARRLHRAQRLLAGAKSGSRCLFQVKSGKVLSDPHTIAGYKQLPHYGFKKFWWNWNDINRMHTIAVGYYNKHLRPVKPRNMPGWYLIVAHNKVVRKRRGLHAALNALRNYKKGSRCIFQIKNGQVHPNPRTIAGYQQKKRFGFNVSWKNNNDIRRMYNIAYNYNRPSPSPSPRPSPSSKPKVIKPKNKRGLFILVDGNKATFHARRLHKAQRLLAGAKSESRCLFQVKSAKVLSDPHTIAGYKQLPQYGFKKFWWNWPDINRMHAIAVGYYNKNLKPIKPKNRQGAYIVVANNRVMGKVRWLDQARRGLSKQKRGSRCIFQVKRGKVVDNPKMIAGYPQNRRHMFNVKWRNNADIRRMYWIARKWNRGFFILVSGDKVIYKSPNLNKAKKHLNAVQGGSRCLFHVKAGVVLGDPHKIAGQNQLPQNGFNKFWWNWPDINRMHAIAVAHYKHMKKQKK